MSISIVFALISSHTINNTELVQQQLENKLFELIQKDGTFSLRDFMKYLLGAEPSVDQWIDFSAYVYRLHTMHYKQFPCESIHELLEMYNDWRAKKYFSDGDFSKIRYMLDWVHRNLDEVSTNKQIDLDKLIAIMMNNSLLAKKSIPLDKTNIEHASIVLDDVSRIVSQILYQMRKQMKPLIQLNKNKYAQYQKSK